MKNSILTIDLTGYKDDKYILDLHDYEIKEEGGTYYMVRKKCPYPKTYEECCEVLNIDSIILPEVRMVYHEESLLLPKLIMLIRCRDAYWKLYGDKAGLGSIWKPDWSTEQERKYVIEVYCNKVRTNSLGYSNTLLAFPTIEVRDEFYKNFKDLIECCKELL